MKIFYAVQATGNGHISRAMEIIPFLERYGQVDLFLSGANSTLPLHASVKFRSKGLCFFYSRNGGLDYLQTLRKFSPLRVLREARDLPVEKYDLVINDFECITSLACAFKKVHSVNFGHQASFVSAKSPRPANKNPAGEWILQNYARASQYIGLHFRPYDHFIFPPIIKDELLQATPTDDGHITVYLPSYSDAVISSCLSGLRDFQFHIFSKEISKPVKLANLSFFHVSRDAFNNSMIRCHGIITSAGFETPAEALHLGKKVLAIPIKGQYEQLCNAAALEDIGVTCIPSLDSHFPTLFGHWVAQKNKASLPSGYSTAAIVSFLVDHCAGNRKHQPSAAWPELTLNG